MPTLFEKIALKELSATIVYENELVMAIEDINPQAAVHVLVFLKECSATGVRFEEMTETERVNLFNGVTNVVQLLGLTDSGYRMIVNSGTNGGQSVDHVHVHILGGERVSSKLN